MAILINKVLTTEGGGSVAANNMIKPKVTFGSDVLERDEDGVYGGTFVRLMKADLGFHYASKAAFQADENNVLGPVQEFKSEYKRVITDQEYTDLMADGSLAEQWILADLNTILGAGICTLIDPFTI